MISIYVRTLAAERKKYDLTFRAGRAYCDEIIRVLRPTYLGHLSIPKVARRLDDFGSQNCKGLTACLEERRLQLRNARPWKKKSQRSFSCCPECEFFFLCKSSFIYLQFKAVVARKRQIEVISITHRHKRRSRDFLFLLVLSTI